MSEAVTALNGNNVVALCDAGNAANVAAISDQELESMTLLTGT